MIEKTFKIIFFVLVALNLSASVPSQSFAQGNTGLVPAKAAIEENSEYTTNSTHPILRLTPDKSELIPLDKDAVSVIVGNPSHLNVLLDTSRLLVAIPRAPGATHFSVLDKNGDIIMQRHVVIASPKEKYVRIHRSCINTEDDNCRATSVYFCPDMCHEIDVTQINEEEGSTVQDLPEDAPAGPEIQDIQEEETP